MEDEREGQIQSWCVDRRDSGKGERWSERKPTMHKYCLADVMLVVTGLMRL